MHTRRAVFCLAFWAALVVAPGGAIPNAMAQTETRLGEPVAVSKGTAWTYIEHSPDGRPMAIGVLFTAGVLEGLPTRPSTTGRCFDANGNGTVEATECLGDYEWILPLPQEDLQRTAIPFQWVGMNWNPEGHKPPAPPVWAVPHFDFHFYTMQQQAVQHIRPGTCGELIDCEDFKRATAPMSARYLPSHHRNVDAAVPAMGNHLIDTTTPELGNPPQPFTHTFIYGAYDGHITFYEPMITEAFFRSKPQVCKTLHLPEAWEVSGYYPTEYCIRYHEQRGTYTVSLTRFVYRKAE